MRFLPVNADAVLIELDDLPQTLALFASLQAEPVIGIDEVVPAARTLLVRFRPSATSAAALERQIGARPLAAAPPRAERRIEIPVHYAGEDLADVAASLGISTDELVRRHTGSDYTVAFTGFAPGFAYLAGGHESLDVPRRSVPRTRIPAGAVALGGRFSGVYPQASPGGWQIIGVTDVPMWDLARPVPALLQPGDAVRFLDAGHAVGTGVAAPARAAPSPPVGAAPAAPSPLVGKALRVRATGLQALFQDTGRGGRAGQGVSASGAMDRRSLQAANRLVGNASARVCIETVYGGLTVVAEADAVVAVTGADGPLALTPAGGAPREVPRWQPLALAAGDALSIGEPRAGLRSYLAVRGGFDVPPVLGSGSTDTLSNVGPPPLAAGDAALVGDALGVVGAAETPPADLPSLGEVVVLDVVVGPRDDWFTAEAVERFAQQAWQVTPQSNRVGLRLAGEVPLARAVTTELPSEGTLRGSIQVPPSGQPVLFMADHPLTGGYPVIASVATHHLDRAGQVPIGARIRFNPICRGTRR